MSANELYLIFIYEYISLIGLAKVSACINCWTTPSYMQGICKRFYGGGLYIFSFLIHICKTHGICEYACWTDESPFYSHEFGVFPLSFQVSSFETVARHNGRKPINFQLPKSCNLKDYILWKDCMKRDFTINRFCHGLFQVHMCYVMNYINSHILPLKCRFNKC